MQNSKEFKGFHELQYSKFIFEIQNRTQHCIKPNKFTRQNSWKQENFSFYILVFLILVLADARAHLQ